MQLENQVVSLELAKRLKELGVKQESLFYWTSFEPGSYILAVHIGTTLFSSLLGSSLGNRDGEYDISAFTVAELGEMFPKFFTISWQRTDDDGEGMIQVEDQETGKKYHSFREPNQADARAKMLIYLLENKLITL